MSTIVKVAQDEDDFGENPLEVSWKNRGKAFKAPNRRMDVVESSRRISSSNSRETKERREVYVERGKYPKITSQLSTNRILIIQAYFCRNLFSIFFFLIIAVLSNIYHHPDDRAITRLSEEFGSYKYIDFEGSSSATSLEKHLW